MSNATVVAPVQVFMIGDKTFKTKKEAMDYQRRPAMATALKTTILELASNEDFVTWLLDNQEGVEMCFETGTIKRVSKSDRTKLEKALEEVVAAANPKTAFLIDNKDAILETFRWPSVKRMDDAEKAAAIRAALVTLAEGNETIADFIIANKDKILAAYSAGKVKKEANPAAMAALAAHHAKLRAAKEAREAAAAAETSAE